MVGGFSHGGAFPHDSYVDNTNIHGGGIFSRGTISHATVAWYFEIIVLIYHGCLILYSFEISIGHPAFVRILKLLVVRIMEVITCQNGLL